MRCIRSLVPPLLLGCAVMAGQATAGDVALHGFVRSVLDVSNSSSPYLETIDNKGDFGDSFAGLNYATRLDEHWSVAGQLFSKVKEGEIELDWAFATFQATNDLVVRFGRQKYPLGLVTENIDIGVTYPWIRPPVEMYSLEMGDESPNHIVENFDGISLAYTTGDEWQFTVQPLIGQHGSSDTTQRKMLGLKLESRSDTTTLQAGFIRTDMNIPTELSDQSRKSFNLGAKLEVANVLAMVEYVDTEVEDSTEFDAKSSYATLGYQAGNFLPSLTYATVEGQSGALDQDSISLALAYTYNPSVIFKAQWQNIKPNDPESDGLIEELPMGDTSVDVFSFSMDLVF